MGGLAVKLVVEEDEEKELSRGERVLSERKAGRCIIAVECVCVDMVYAQAVQAEWSISQRTEKNFLRVLC
jgi:hypothetical protein